MSPLRFLPMTTRRREIGYAAAWSKTEGSYAFHPSEYDALKTAWMKGAAFFTGQTLHGDECTVKLACVEAVMLYTPEGIASVRAEEDADRSDDMLTGVR